MATFTKVKSETNMDTFSTSPHVQHDHDIATFSTSSSNIKDKSNTNIVTSLKSPNVSKYKGNTNIATSLKSSNVKSQGNTNVATSHTSPHAKGNTNVATSHTSPHAKGNTNMATSPNVNESDIDGSNVDEQPAKKRRLDNITKTVLSAFTKGFWLNR